VAAARESVQVVDVSKRFGPTVALSGVSFTCEAGMVHGLIGENGAGKSTLVKILSGLLRPDRGEIRVHGSVVSVGSPAVAKRAGVATVFQELLLVPHTTVARNVVLGAERLPALGFVSQKRLNRLARDRLAAVGIQDVAPDDPVDELPLAAKQKLSVAAALAARPRVLILDEATSALGPADVEWLFASVREMAERGCTILVITHRLAEMRRMCDRITVLRDGAAVGTYDREEVTDDEIVQRMVGQSLEAVERRRPAREPEAPGAAPLLEARRLTGRDFQDVSLAIAPGEVVGVAALQGQGQREFFRALFGNERILSGDLLVGGRRVRLRAPADAIAAGIALIPEERKTEGLLLDLTGRENVSLASLGRLCRLGVIDRGAEAAAVGRLLSRLDVDPRALRLPVSAFSGGNQQKMLFAKWLMTEARVLLLYDPTRGVDVGAKRETYRIMRELAERRAGLLFYSTEVEELLHLPDRVLIFYRGRVVAEFHREQLSGEGLLRAMMGIAAPGAPTPTHLLKGAGQ
jgi:ribose transport system ATP-binding protein